MLNLLLVEDERFTREGLYYDLNWKKLGIDQVRLAENGYSALEIIKNFLPNILLTDVKMPKMNGIDLAYKVKEINPDCSVIFISGYSDKEYLMSAIELNALNYVEKPINLDELTKCLEKAVLEQHNLFEKRISIENSITLRLSDKNLDFSILTDLKRIIPDFDNNLNTITFIATIPYEDEFCKSLNFVEQISILKGSLHNLEFKHILGIQNNKIIIHVFYQDFLGENFIEKLAISIYESLKKALHTSRDIYLGAGKPVNNILQIHESYNTAVDALKNSFFAPEKHVHIYEENKYAKKSLNTLDIDPYLDRMISEFAKFLNEGDQEKCISTVKTIKQFLCNSPKIDINTVFNVFFNLFVELEKSKTLNNFSKNKVSNSNIWNNISSARSIVELENLLISHINKFFEDIYQINANPIVNSIKELIDKKYHEPGFSLKDISKSLYMCPSYICVLFKKETSKTVSQYINEVRIEKSLKLLKDKRYTINDIATKVGFENANYYSKVFKKFKGITPIEYRRRFFR